MAMDETSARDARPAARSVTDADLLAPLDRGPIGWLRGPIGWLRGPIGWLRSVLVGVVRGVDTAIEVVVVVAVVAEIVVVVANVIGRDYFSHPIDWSLESSAIPLAIIVYMGGAIAYRRGEHIYVRFVVDKLPDTPRRALAVVVEWLVIALSLFVAMQQIPSLQAARQQAMTTLPISEVWTVLPMTVGLLLFAYYGLRQFLCGANVRTAAISLAVVVAIVILSDHVDTTSLQLASSIAFTLSLVIFVVLLVVGLPIAFVMIAAAIGYLYLSGASIFQTVPITMQSSAESYTTLAVPFFILAGLIMAEGGLSRPLAEFANTLVRRLPGRLHLVLIVTTFIFSGMSGSKLADMSAVGSSMREMLEDGGYDSAESSAVIAAASVAGETIPPSLAFLILAPIVSLPLASLFEAGILPAVFISLALMVVVVIRSRKRPRSTPTGPYLATAARLGLRAAPAVFMPVLLIGGLILGVATPTEISSFAVIYGVLVAFVVYRKMSVRDLWRVMLLAASTAGMVLFMVSAASAFSWGVSVANIPEAVSQPLIRVGLDSPFLFFLVTILIMVVLGSVTEGLPALLIFAPILFPIAVHLGIDPIHFAVVFVVAMGLGLCLPPMGILAYFAAKILGTSIERAWRPMLIMLLVPLVCLLLLALFPWITLVVPNALH